MEPADSDGADLTEEVAADGRTYRILEQLGVGGFARVYRAEAIGAAGFSKQVALKILKSDDVPEEIAVRFRDEARMLGLLRHRAVVSMDGIAELGDRVVIVMEYVPGVDVKALVASGPPVSVSLAITEEVASALHAAWALPTDLTCKPIRLIHRDIKPANIRVTPLGEVKVVDFGGARAEFVQREAVTESLVLGSYRYMAPERMDQLDSPAGDVYSLGLVLAELLLGSGVPPPAKHAEQHAVFVAALEERVVAHLSAQGVGRQRTEEAMELIRRMLDYFPQRRPTARAVELACRRLGRQLRGPLLRAWAEDHIPAMMGISLPLDTQDLVVPASTAAMRAQAPRSLPSPATSMPLPGRLTAFNPWPVVVAGTVVFGLVATGSHTLRVAGPASTAVALSGWHPLTAPPAPVGPWGPYAVPSTVRGARGTASVPTMGTAQDTEKKGLFRRKKGKKGTD